MKFIFKHFCFVVVFLSVKVIGENASTGFMTQESFDLQEPQFNCSDSALKHFNATLFELLHPVNNRTFSQFSLQYWLPHFPEKVKNVRPTTYHMSDLQNGTSYKRAIGQQVPRPRACTILRTELTKTPRAVERLMVFVINSTHAFATWKPVKVPPGANVTYRTFMKRGSHDHQIIELICHNNKTSCIVKKDQLPKSFDVFVHVHVVYHKGSKLEVRLVKVGWNFIELAWNSLSRYYENVKYFLLHMSEENREDKIEANQDGITLEGLQQYTSYSIQVQAVKEGVVVASSEWTTVRTADYDECAANGDHNCGPTGWCVNTQGSFFCQSCKEGYQRNGYNCTDYDECKQNTHKCDVNAECINTQESYSCRCNPGFTGDGHKCSKIILRKCNDMKQLPSWEDPDFNHCVNKEIASVLDKLRESSTDHVAEAKQLAHLITDDQSEPLYASDLKLVTSSLEILSSEDVLERVSGKQSADAKDYSKIKDYGMSVLNISNRILDKKLLPSWRQVPKGSAASLANKVIESNDKVALLLSKNNNTKDIYEERDNMVFSVRGIPADDDLSDQLLPPTSGMREGSVYVPASVLKNQNSSKGMRYLSFVSYKTIHEILQIEPEFIVLPPVVSVTLTPLNNNSFDQPVVITVKQPEGKISGEPTCSFLNASKRDDISWSTEGCEVGSSNETHVECLCYHLTSFAILMQVKEVDAEAIAKEHHFALGLISYIGLCSSIAALFIVFVTFAFIRFLKLPRHFIHANLALSLALAHVTFLFGINRTETKVLCKALAVALHYLFLVAFTWMALEGFVLYLMLVKVFQSSMSGRKTKLIFFFSGWGIPAVIVAVSSGVYPDGYGTDKFCWLSLDRQFIWAFVAPVLVVIAFNFLCLGGTFYVMAKRGSNSENKVEKFRYWARSCGLLTCILGVTWLLGVFFVNKHTLFMAYLFSIFNGFQGLMIFLLHCIGDRKIRTAYVRILRCNSDPYASSSGGAKLLYKQSLASRSGSARDHPSDQRTSDDQKHPGKQKPDKSLLKSPGTLKQAEGGEKEQSSKSVRISDELSSRPYASAYGEKEDLEMSRYSRADSFREASAPLINEANSDNSYSDPTQMKLHPQWV